MTRKKSRGHRNDFLEDFELQPKNRKSKSRGRRNSSLKDLALKPIYRESNKPNISQQPSSNDDRKEERSDNLNNYPVDKQHLNHFDKTSAAPPPAKIGRTISSDLLNNRERNKPNISQQPSSNDDRKEERSDNLNNYPVDKQHLNHFDKTSAAPPPAEIWRTISSDLLNNRERNKPNISQQPSRYDDRKEGRSDNLNNYPVHKQHLNHFDKTSAAPPPAEIWRTNPSELLNNRERNKPNISRQPSRYADRSERSDISTNYSVHVQHWNHFYGRSASLPAEISLNISSESEAKPAYYTYKIIEVTMEQIISTCCVILFLIGIAFYFIYHFSST